ncbi:GntR family transcriptional regulator [Pseudovibrio exalbescens]|uniref:GntR family transcriptional regulator n=1 Tax=Pseudovibrio exalbescens TaxID=197461 RepID=UPI00236611D0|nr:GntR family transcriptional regulator [Pseudovibrio exalbescens]MDD7909875.1 GntR family transcriptional regulator [Pseudovibrio exalbescens]
MPALSSNVFLAYTRLKDAILKGKFAPNQRMLEQEAADFLKMSRTPVREAMLLLEKDGLIQLRPRHGMQVLDLSREDIREIYQMIAALEPIAARALAQGDHFPSHIKPLEDALEMMELATAQNQMDIWAAADRKFHENIVSLSGHNRMSAVLTQLWDQSHRARIALLRDPASKTASTAEHIEIFEAIRFGHGELAFERHQAHLENECARIMQIIAGIELPKENAEA